MTRTLTARTQELAYDRTLRPIPLVKLTTYSNRDTGVVDQVHYFSDRGVRFDGQNWLPYLLRVEPLTMEMSHLPDGSGQDGAFDRTASIVLRNPVLSDGRSLSETLYAQNLLRARIELGQILAGENEAPLRDLGGLASAEFVAWFRGEVRQVGPILDDGEITLRLGSELPNLPLWTVGREGIAATRDRGKQIKLAYGYPKRVPALAVEVGGFTTLTRPLTTTATRIYVTDPAEFASSGSGRVNGERISWTSIGQTTAGTTLGEWYLDGVTRADGEGKPQAHNAGGAVVYIPATVKYCVGQAGCTVQALYIRSLVTEELTRITADGSFAYNENDSSVAAIGPNRPVSTASIAGDDLHKILSDMVRAEMTKQPQYDAGGSSVITTLLVPTGNHTIGSHTSSEAVMTRVLDINSTTPQINRQVGQGGPGDETAVFNYAVNQGNLDARPVNRYRFKMTVDVTRTSSTFGTLEWRFRVANTDVNGWPGISAPYFVTETHPGTDWTVGQTRQFETFSPWITPPENTQLADFRDANFRFEAKCTNSATSIAFDWHLVAGAWGVEFEVITGGVQQVIEGEIAAAAGGVTLEMFADLRGPQAPTDDQDYSDVNGIVSRFPDIVMHVLKEWCGVPSSQIDAASFKQAHVDTDQTLIMRTVLNDYGPDLRSILGAIAFQSRTNILQAEDTDATVWRMSTGVWDGNDFAFSPILGTLTDYVSARERGRDGEDIFNQFSFLLDLDLALESGDETAYKRSIRADSDGVDTNVASRLRATDIADSVTRYGKRQHPGFFFPAYSDELAMSQSGAYYARHILTERATIEVEGVPWVTGWRIERGDVYRVKLPGRTVDVKGRVVEVTRNFDTQLIDLVLVEVP